MSARKARKLVSRRAYSAIINKPKKVRKSGRKIIAARAGHLEFYYLRRFTKTFRKYK